MSTITAPPLPFYGEGSNTQILGSGTRGCQTVHIFIPTMQRAYCITIVTDNGPYNALLRKYTTELYCRNEFQYGLISGTRTQDPY